MMNRVAYAEKGPLDGAAASHWNCGEGNIPTSLQNLFSRLFAA